MNRPAAIRSSSNDPPSDKLSHLEKSWNPNVSIRPEQRRLVQMSQDIKTFIVKSLSDPEETQKAIEKSNRMRERAFDSFEQISSTLGFVHHEGTDKNLELKVVKVVMVREGLLMSLRHTVESANRTNTLNGTNILELLAQLREKTLNYLEALCLWRQSAVDGDGNGAPGTPRVFMWEYQNYTIKAINDMDFLADSTLIINTLKIPPDQFRSNPLMLSNNLEDINTWMDPYDRAVMDTNGVTVGTEFETRLRLRFAERILLQELESNNTNNSQQFFLTQTNEGNMNPQGAPMMNQNYYNGNNNYYGNNYDPNELMVGSSALEDDYESNEGKGYNYYNSPTNHQQPMMQGQAGVQRRVYPDRTASNDSKDSQNPIYRPNSRTSTMSSGYAGYEIAYENENNPRASFSQGLSSAGGGGPDPYSSTFQYGHEFFQENWGGEDSRTSAGPPANGMMYPGGGDGIFDSFTQRAPPSNTNNYPSSHNPSNSNQSIDQASTSVRSIRSLEIISDQDIKAVMTIKPPPKTAVLTGSVIITVLSRENKIPIDLGWKSFMRLCKTENVAQQMNELDPDHVSGFKIIAIQPMLDELVEDRLISSNVGTSSSAGGLEHSVAGMMAMNKLIGWAKQFTLNALKKQKKFGIKSPLRLSNPNFVPLPAHWTAPSSDSLSPNNRSSRKPKELSPLQIDRNAGEVSSAAKTGGKKKGKKFQLLRYSRKIVVPRIQLNLDTVHTEVLESHPSKHPLLFVVLTSPPDDPNVKKPPKSTATASTATVPSVDDAGVRIVLKVYDSVTSEEVLLHVNIREYALFLEDYARTVGEKVHLAFQPDNVFWWAAHGSKVVSIQETPNGKLKVTISKRQLIEVISHNLSIDHQQHHPHPGLTPPLSTTPPPILSHPSSNPPNNAAVKETKKEGKKDKEKEKDKDKDKEKDKEKEKKKADVSLPPTNVKTASTPPPVVLQHPLSAQDRSRLQAKRTTSPAVVSKISAENSTGSAGSGSSNQLVEKRQSMPNVKLHDYTLLPKASSKDSTNDKSTQPKAKSSSREVSRPVSNEATITLEKPVEGRVSKQPSLDLSEKKSNSISPPIAAPPVEIVVAKEASVASSNPYEEDFVNVDKPVSVILPPSSNITTTVAEVPPPLNEEFSQRRTSATDYSLEGYDEVQQLQEYLQDNNNDFLSTENSKTTQQAPPPASLSAFSSPDKAGHDISLGLIYSEDPSYYMENDNHSTEDKEFREFFENIEEKKNALRSSASSKKASDIFALEPEPSFDEGIAFADATAEPLPVPSGSIIEEENQIDEFPSYASTSVKQQKSTTSANSNPYGDDDFDQPLPSTTSISGKHQRSTASASSNAYVEDDFDQPMQSTSVADYASTSVKQQKSTTSTKSNPYGDDDFDQPLPSVSIAEIPSYASASAKQQKSTTSAQSNPYGDDDFDQPTGSIAEFPSYVSTSAKQEKSMPSVSSNQYLEDDFEQQPPSTSIVEEEVGEVGMSRKSAADPLNMTSGSVASYEYDDFESFNNSLARSQQLPPPGKGGGGVQKGEGDKEQENEQEKEEPSHYYDEEDEDLYNIEEE